MRAIAAYHLRCRGGLRRARRSRGRSRARACRRGRQRRPRGRSACRPVGRADEHAILVVTVCGTACPERAVLLVGVEPRQELFQMPFDDALALPGVEVDPEALERLLHRLEHRGDRIALVAGEVLDVRAVVAVLGDRLAVPRGLDGEAEALHLTARIVVVVLALDSIAGEVEQPRDAVSVRPVSGVRDEDRPGRVRGDHLDLDVLGQRDPAAAVALAHLRERGDEERVCEPEVEEPGPATSTAVDVVESPRSAPRARLRSPAEAVRPPLPGAARRWWRSRRRPRPSAARARPRRRRRH